MLNNVGAGEISKVRSRPKKDWLRNTVNIVVHCSALPHVLEYCTVRRFDRKSGSGQFSTGTV